MPVQVDLISEGAAAHSVRELAAVQGLLLPGAAIIGAVGCLLNVIVVPHGAAAGLHEAAMTAAAAVQIVLNP